MNMTAYKLTDEQGCTYNGTKWGPGITHRAEGLSTESCSNGVIHYYESFPLALLVNPVYSNFDSPLCWEVEVVEPLGTDGLKCWAKEVTTIRRVESPVITTTNKIAFGILCTLEICTDPTFVIWGTNWLLNGADRTIAAAWAARWADAARWAEPARWAEAATAARAAWVAADADKARSATADAEAATAAREARSVAAARLAGWSAFRDRRVWAATHAADAAWLDADAKVAWAVARAATWSATVAAEINFIAIADQAMLVK